MGMKSGALAGYPGSNMLCTNSQRVGEMWRGRRPLHISPMVGVRGGSAAPALALKSLGIFAALNSS